MDYQLVVITPDNIQEEGIFCIKGKQSVGFKRKVDWYINAYPSGLRMVIAKGSEGEQMGFIEYSPAEFSWRPVEAPQYYFIHCMFVYPNKNRGQGIGSALIKHCEEEAKLQQKLGVTIMTSKGAWITDKRLLVKNGFSKVDKLGRFELMVKKFNQDAEDPQLIDWNKGLKAYKGWHLLYADQCPWHEKAAKVMEKVAAEKNFPIHIEKVDTPEKAKLSPSGFGVFALVKDGKLIEDHYISERRFLNILEKEGVG